MSAVRVGVVYYGAGNIYSVLRGLRAAGTVPEVLRGPDDFAGTDFAGHDRLVLPGVGAFGEGMANLRARGLVAPLRAHVAAGKPLLGICLGAQLLMGRSEEFGHHEGLGLIPGAVVALDPGEGLRVPHVGWAPLEPVRDWAGTPLATLGSGDFAYFNHSFACRPDDEADVLARFPFGADRPVAAVARGAVCGVQFHPELSAGPGHSVLRSFVAAPAHGTAFACTEN